MWKYVGHRIKDSAELTCSHLKNLRSTFSTCETKTAKDIPKQERFRCFDNWNNGRVFNVWECFDSKNKWNQQNKQKKEANIDTAYFIEKYSQKQKQKQHEAFQKCCDVNFLQWVRHALFLYLP